MNLIDFKSKFRKATIAAFSLAFVFILSDKVGLNVAEADIPPAPPYSGDGGDGGGAVGVDGGCAGTGDGGDAGGSDSCCGSAE